jgi:hypothetical protein
MQRWTVTHTDHAAAGEIILETLFQSGSLTVFGVRTATGWRFQVHYVRFGPNRGPDDPSAYRRKSDWVDSWEAALALLNERRYWHMTSAHQVHPDFRQRALAAVQERFGREAARRKNDPGWERACRDRLDQWRRVCHGEPPFSEDEMTVHLPAR